MVDIFYCCLLVVFDAEELKLGPYWSRALNYFSGPIVPLNSLREA